MKELSVVGGGLAGCEAAWQAATLGVKVDLYEMRPEQTTPAHVTGDLAELVCSNSLGSTLPTRPSGLLQQELLDLGSLLIQCAHQTSLPAGGALAVDRQAFSRQVTKHILSHPNITVYHQSVENILKTPTIFATGPLTSLKLSDALHKYLGSNHLYFFDAIAPIVELESINQTIAFRASRFDRGSEESGDYLNCPLDEDQYHQFVDALIHAQKAELAAFETEIHESISSKDKFFEGCLPIEVMASRGIEALAFGPMRPIGLRDPRTAQRPYAVLQLRQDNLAGTLYNMVGFQTNLTYPEQSRVFRMIPGMEGARFIRYGQMHRNTFIASPALLHETLQYRKRSDIFFAGQLAGVEGYIGSIATGLVAGINAARIMQKQAALIFPRETMIGGLIHYICNSEVKTFQPMKANFGLLPPLFKRVKSKKERNIAYSVRSLEVLRSFIGSLK
jgi:methylenetetrahydrofolate--tRNA-(uracil-5-)-methyltransferase